MPDFENNLKLVAKSFEENGFAVVEDFLTGEQVESMRNEIKRLIREESRSDKLQVFGNEFNVKSRFFLESADKVCYFFEKAAIDLETLELQCDEQQSLAKIAHALHCLNPVFEKVTKDKKVSDVLRALGLVAPTVVQSMVIFKNPKVGGAYSPHQDASFLHTEPPNGNLVGMWIPIDDSTLENGCLEFVPGSHRWPLKRRLIRTGNSEDGQLLLDWQPAEALEVDESKFVRVPVKSGSLVLIDGLVVHRSAANTSEKPRWAYTFHSYDSAKSKWSAENWLQMHSNKTFVQLY